MGGRGAGREEGGRREEGGGRRRERADLEECKRGDVDDFRGVDDLSLSWGESSSKGSKSTVHLWVTRRKEEERGVEKRRRGEEEKKEDKLEGGE